MIFLSQSQTFLYIPWYLDDIPQGLTTLQAWLPGAMKIWLGATRWPTAGCPKGNMNIIIFLGIHHCILYGDYQVKSNIAPCTNFTEGFSNSMESRFSCISIPVHLTNISFCTQHNREAVVSCAKFRSDYIISICISTNYTKYESWWWNPQ